MADDVEIKFGAQVEGVQAGITQVRETLQGLTEPLRAVRENLGSLAEAFVAAFAVEKINSAIESLTRLNEETKKASLITGLPVDQVTALKAASENVGISLETVDRAFARLGVNLANESKPAQRAIEAIGLSFKQLATESPLEQFNTVGAALARMSDIASRDAASNALFGRSFLELLPLFAEGGDAIKEWQSVVEETGASVARASAELDRTKTSMTTLGLAVQGDGIDIFMVFSSAINGVYASLAKVAEAFHAAASEIGIVQAVLAGLGNAAKTVVTAMVAIGGASLEVANIANHAFGSIALAFVGVGETIAAVIVALRDGLGNFFAGLVTAATDAAHAIGSAFVDLGSVIKNGITGNFGEAKAAFGALGSDASSAAGKIHSDLQSSVSGFDFSAAKSEFGGFLDDEKSNAQRFAGEEVNIFKQAKDLIDNIWSAAPKQPEITQDNPNKIAPIATGKDKGAKDALEAQLAADNQEIASAKNVLKSKEDILNAELKDKQISTSQWLAGTIDALRQELSAEQAALDQELSLNGLSLKQKQDLENKKLQAVQQEAIAEEQAQIKAAEASQKAWDSANKEISSAFTGQVDGLLKGTETFATAFQNIFASLVEDAIKALVKMGVEWALQHAEQIAGIGALTAAQTSASAAQAGAAASGAAAATAASKPGILASIQADVGQAFAGFAAFFAPILGPAAPAAAAGLAGSVDAEATGLAAFDVGSNYVPMTGLAKVHEGETIIPASAQGAPYSGGRGGGDTHNHTWNIQATDARSFTNMLNDRSSDLAKAVARATGGNRSLRPAW